MNLPITDPVLKFTLYTAIILLAPMLSSRLRIPGVIGLIVAGILVGPHSYGFMERDEAIVLLGTAGLLYIMFVAGVEVDMHEFRRARRRSMVFGALTFFIPQILGTLVGVWLLKFNWMTSILLASMFASHTLVAYPTISGFALSRREPVIVAVGGTIITDTAALLVLAVIAGMAQGTVGPGFWMRLGLSMAIFLPAMLLGLPALGRWFFRNIGGEGGPQFLFVLVVLFGSAFVAHLAGLEPIIGAFFAGLALNRLIPEHSTLMNRIQFFGNYFFIPFFLISVGMLVDVRTLALDARSWQVAIAMVATVIVAKWIAARAAQALFHYEPEAGWVIFSLSVAQAAATLAAVLVGYRLEIFDDSILNGTILMILVTCLVAPWVAERYGRRMAIRHAEMAPPIEEGPERFLVPVSNPVTATALVDFSALLRKQSLSDAPLHLLNVVDEEGDEPTKVAAGEQVLGACMARAAAADVPVNPVVRLDMNVADGVVRAVRELRVTTLVVGWKGFANASERIFGSKFDQILEKCLSRIIVCKLDAALNTSRRLILVVPPLGELDRQFDQNVHDVKNLARQLGLGLTVVAASPSQKALRERIEIIQPHLPVYLTAVTGWKDARIHVEEMLTNDDLLVVFSAREGALAWQPAVERLPRMLASRHPDLRLIVVYPAAWPLREESEPETQPGFLVAEAILEPEGLAVAQEGENFDALIARMLARVLPDHPEQARALHETLRNVAREYPAEIAPGVIVLHAHNTPVPSLRVLVGVSPQGITAPQTSHPMHAVFVLLGAPEQPVETHVRALAGIARVLRQPWALKRLIAATSASEARGVFEVTEE